jgi:hypothetical protein
VTDSEPADDVWRKSKASNASGECVEVAFADDAVLVRHSHNPSGPLLSFSQSEWKAFLDGARNGEFDLP